MGRPVCNHVFTRVSSTLSTTAATLHQSPGVDPYSLLVVSPPASLHVCGPPVHYRVTTPLPAANPLALFPAPDHFEARSHLPRPGLHHARPDAAP